MAFVKAAKLSDAPEGQAVVVPISTYEAKEGDDILVGME